MKIIKTKMKKYKPSIKIIKSSLNQIGSGLIIAGIVASAFQEIIPLKAVIIIIITGIISIYFSSLEKIK